MADTKFYFARIKFVQSGIDDYLPETPENVVENNRKKLLDYIRSSKVIHVEPLDDGEEAYWRFGKHDVQNGNIVGKLGKDFTESQTQWVEEREDYVQEGEEVEVADVSHFVIFPDVPGIAFNRKLRIGPNQFRDAFLDGYNSYSEHPGKIEFKIQRIGGDKDFEEIVAAAERITRVEFNLEPTNPYPDEDMEILDDHIRAMGADDFVLRAEVEEEEEEQGDETNEAELEPREDFIRSGAAMSNGGYGSYQVKYYDEEGEDHQYNSKGERAREELPEPETPGGLVPYIGRLHDRLKELVGSEEVEESDTQDGA